MRSERRSRRGVTLTELLLSMVVMSIALVALLGLQTMAVIMHQKAEDTRHAVDWCTQQLEQVRRTPFSELEEMVGEYNVPALDTPAAEGRITVAPLEGRSDIKVVTITVAWRGHSRGSMQVETYASQVES